MSHPSPRNGPRPVRRVVAALRRLAPTGLVLATISVLTIAAFAASEPGEGIRVPSLEEFNALEERVTDLEGRVAELATPTGTPSGTPTVTPTETPSETPTATPTSPSTCTRPEAGNTGHTGTLVPYDGPSRITTAGTVVQDVEITAPLVVAAADVTIRNVRSTASIGTTARGTRILDSTVPNVWASSASAMLVDRTEVGGTRDGDSVHVTSDAGAYIEGFTLRRSWIHDIDVPSDSHYDGIQVRGATDVLVECNNFDLGPFQDTYNAAIYLEDANGGYSVARVVDNWVSGGAFNLMLGAARDDGVVLTGNRLGGDVRWGLCSAQSATSLPAVQTGNTVDGQPVTPCA